MNILIKQATIVSPGHEYHGQNVDMYIQKGIITVIAKSYTPDTKHKIIESPNLHCSLGWVDVGTHIAEPGLEQRETLMETTRCAKAGGYTAIAVMPNTVPVTDHKSAINWLTYHEANSICRILPIASISQGCKGEALTEMLELADSGAVAFCDGLKPIEKSGLLLRALQYGSVSRRPIIHHAYDSELIKDTQMHEGRVSTLMGLKGSPTISETMMIKRDLDIADYAEQSIVFHAVSTAAGVTEIIKAKKADIDASLTVTIANLTETDQALDGFNANYKLSPHLRSQEDRKALCKHVAKGQINAIVTNHKALEEEVKAVEFPWVKPGMLALETAYPMLQSCIDKGEFTLDAAITCLTTGPRSLLRLPSPEIAVGAVADLTLFDPDVEWVYDRSHSTSKNSPYLGQKMKGKVIDTVFI